MYGEFPPTTTHFHLDQPPADDYLPEINLANFYLIKRFTPGLIFPSQGIDARFLSFTNRIGETKFIHTYIHIHTRFMHKKSPHKKQKKPNVENFEAKSKSTNKDLKPLAENYLGDNCYLDLWFRKGGGTSWVALPFAAQTHSNDPK